MYQTWLFQNIQAENLINLLVSLKIVVVLQSTNLTSSMAISEPGTGEKEPKPLFGKARNLN